VKATPQPFRFVGPGEEAAFLAPLSVGLLGLPPEVERKLRRLGIQTAGAAAAIPEAEWVRQFRDVGRRIAKWSRGIEPDRVRAAYPERAIAKRIDLNGEAPEPDELEARINRIAAGFAKALTDRGEGCQEVALELVAADGARQAGSRLLAHLQQRPYALQQAFGHLLRQVYTKRMPLSALAVRVTGIGPMPWEQMVLWGETNVPDKDAKLEEVLCLMNERFPSRLIGRGPRKRSSWREQMLTFSDPYRWAAAGTPSWHA
jgi:nucleotidyltransferase/DNA polymerase involved in DNA repair